MQSRALHSDELRGAGDVAAEAVDLRDQIFALEHFARLAQWNAHQLLAADAARNGRHQSADLSGQHRGGDLRLRVSDGEDHQAFDIVAQLADVPRPVVRLQHRHRVGGDSARRHAHCGGDLLKKIMHELGNILAPLGERGDADRHHREAMEEIFAKMTVSDRLGEIAAGRGDDANVDMDPRRAADPLEILIDQHAEDLRLRLQRHVGDFIEIERAPVRLFERADTSRPVGGRFDAEQLALHVLGRDRGRVEDDERTVGAHRVGVDEARRQLLARPGGAGDQHPRIGGPQPLDDALEIDDRRGGADDAIGRARARAQVADLAFQPRRLQRPLGHQNQAIGFERLFNEIVRAELDRRHRGLDVAVAGDHHHRHVAVLLLDDLEQLQTVEPRALQPDVEQHEMRTARLDRRQRLVGIARQTGRVAFVGENARNELTNVVLVIDDQNIGWHQDDRPLATGLGLREVARRGLGGGLSATAVSSAPARRSRRRRAAGRRATRPRHDDPRRS